MPELEAIPGGVAESPRPGTGKSRPGSTRAYMTLILCTLQRFGQQFDNHGQAGVVLLRKMFIAEHTTPKHMSFAVKDLRTMHIIVTDTEHSRTYTIKFPRGMHLTQACYDALLKDLEWARSVALNNDDVARPPNPKMPEILMESAGEIEAAPYSSGVRPTRAFIVPPAVDAAGGATTNGTRPSPAPMPGAARPKAAPPPGSAATFPLSNPPTANEAALLRVILQLIGDNRTLRELLEMPDDAADVVSDEIGSILKRLAPRPAGPPD